MPGTRFESDSDFDPQDQAETFDEATISGDDSPFAAGEDMRTFEEMPDVYDVTSRFGDRDRDEGLAFDADEFSDDAFDDDDLEDDNELDYAAVDEEHEDDLDGLGLEAGAIDNVEGFSSREIEGLDETGDAAQVTGGEDDFTNFQAKGLADDDLKRMGYSEERDGEMRAKPDKR
jgi:hypothetical protein